MSDFLATLVARARGEGEPIAPLIPSRYEPAPLDAAPVAGSAADPLAEEVVEELAPVPPSRGRRAHVARGATLPRRAREPRDEEAHGDEAAKAGESERSLPADGHAHAPRLDARPREDRSGVRPRAEAMSGEAPRPVERLHAASLPESPVAHAPDATPSADRGIAAAPATPSAVRPAAPAPPAAGEAREAGPAPRAVTPEVRVVPGPKETREEDTRREDEPEVSPAPALPTERVPARGETAAASSGTVVRVSIGRIEVRAIMPPAPAAPSRAGGPALRSLDDYLRAREGRPS